MSNATQLAIVGVLAAGVGFGIGRATAQTSEPAAAAKPAKPSPDELKTGSKASADKPPEAAKLAKCQTSLDQCDEMMSVLGQPFPAKGFERPSEWRTMVEGCNLAPWTVALVDCSEYPCVAGLRREKSSGPMPTGKARLEERLEVEKKLSTCPTVAAALGEKPEDNSVAAVPLQGTCDNVTVGFWGVAVIDPEGEAFAAAVDDEESDEAAERTIEWFERRAAAVQLKWPCG